MNRFSVSVAFPAFNEEKNIAALIGDVLAQEQNGWTLDSLTLFDDGSTDATVHVAQKAYKDIRVLTSKVRAGKSSAVQHILNANTADIIILFDADVRLQNNQCINELVNAFRQDDAVMLAGGNVFPMIPTTFVQRGIYATYKVFYKSKKEFKNGNNIFGCVGSCMALRNTFAHELSIPHVVSDDAYIYLACIDKGYTFKYVDEARVRYKLASTLTDHLKQQFRGAEALPVLLKGHFDDLLKKEMHRPAPQYLKYVWQSWKADPPATTFIIIVTLFVKLLVPIISVRYKPAYPMAHSTK